MTPLQRHNAPAVALRLGSRRWLRRGLWLAWALGLMAALFFGWASSWTARSALIFAVLPLSAWGVCSYLRSLPHEVLFWTGEQWRWHAQAVGDDLTPGTPAGRDDWSVALEPVWDVQDAVLLRWQREPSSSLGKAEGGWFWGERPADMPMATWLAFRRAVYSPARHQEPVLGMADR
ncbi:MAG: hypothetical protein GAK30_03089 [Paracidovorax wautersii]|uniref:Uncharacterized protein n=1 Tax=Paracidovorax wautersii TaxID=1177982 RepID=A0A7V8FLT7_9BURK|nr:MAG: hypothetical protein GAK30_03089 [Paracidovorax wautersii]